jgi:hypothetical protein
MDYSAVVGLRRWVETKCLMVLGNWGLEVGELRCFEMVAGELLIVKVVEVLLTEIADVLPWKMLP